MKDPHFYTVKDLIEVLQSAPDADQFVLIEGFDGMENVRYVTFDEDGCPVIASD